MPPGDAENPAHKRVPERRPAPAVVKDSWFGIALLCVLAVATVARVSTLGVQAFWLDELHSLLNSAGHRAQFEALPYGELLDRVPRYTELGPDSSVAHVWHRMRNDSHPPVYFTLLYAWRRLVGDSEFAVRLLSALFSVLSIVPVALILREYGRPRVAIGAALLLGFTFAHVQMGQQARPYSLATLLVATSYWLLVKMERRWGSFSAGSRYCCAAAYGLTLCLAVLTHYFAGLALLGQGVFALLRFRQALLRCWIAGVSLALIACAVVWLPGFLAQLEFISAQDWVLERGPDHAWRTAIRAADLPLRLSLRLPLHDWTGAGGRYRAILGLALLLAALIGARRRGSHEALLFVLWYAVPAVTLTAIDLAADRQLLSHLRYAAVSAPGLVALLAIAAAQLRRPLPVLLGAAAAILVSLTLRLPATSNPHARVAARLVQEQIRSGDVLIFDAIGWIPLWTRREFALVWQYLPPTNCRVLMLSEPPSAALRERIRSHERLLVVSPRIDAVPNHAPRTHRLAARSPYIHDIGWVYLFDRIDANPARRPD